MQTRKVKDMHFYFKDNLVVMAYHHQYIAFHNHGRSNKRTLKSFAHDIQNTRHLDLSRVFYIARLHNVPSMSVTEAVLREVTENGS